jgi:hypothetical protein
MTSRLSVIFVFLWMAVAVHAQTEAEFQVHSRFQLYGGYAFLSNSFNGLPGSRQPLNGWAGSISVPGHHDLHFRFEASGYRGTNQGASQNSIFFMGGPQLFRRFGRETAFVEALLGDGGLPRYWGPNGAPGETASFATVLGGGLDTPISRSLAIRVSGGYQWSNFKLINNIAQIEPIQTPGLPNNFWRVSSGLVWSF